MEGLEAISELSKRIVHNTRVTRYILRHCAFNDIKHYRLSSAIFPLLTDKSLGISFSDLPNSAIIRNELKLVGLIAKKYNISIGSHPDQFNVLASTDREKVDRTINELNFQASVLDMIGLPQDHTAPMNIHINYTPKMDETLEIVSTRFFRNLSMCDAGVYNRLTIENEDKGFNVIIALNLASIYLIHSVQIFLFVTIICMIFAIHQRITMLYFKQSVALIHG